MLFRIARKKSLFQNLRRGGFSESDPAFPPEINLCLGGTLPSSVV